MVSKIINIEGYNYKDIIDIKKNEFATIKSVCDLFKCDRKAIVSIHRRNEELLDKHRITLSGDKLKQLKDNGVINTKVNSRICLYTKEYILYVALLLSNSSVALAIREEMRRVDIKLFEEYEVVKTGRFKKHENDIENFLNYTFGSENVKKQSRVGKYKLDFVLFNKISVEVDENGHKDYNKTQEKLRDTYISENTNFKTIRYNPNKDKPYILIHEILNNLNELHIAI